jgi:hypothetical protein
VHDCGRVINPVIVEGQIQGGVAHGIGNAFYEQLVYDDNGQLMNASFMDYLLPTATDVPKVETDHSVTTSPWNPLGVKGVGEAGAIPTGAASHGSRVRAGRRGRVGPRIRDPRDPSEPEPPVGADAGGGGVRRGA